MRNVIERDIQMGQPLELSETDPTSSLGRPSLIMDIGLVVPIIGKRILRVILVIVSEPQRV